MSTRRLLTTVALLGVLVTSACAGVGDQKPDAKLAPQPSARSVPTLSKDPVKGITSYVALGDSYTSGPGIATQEQSAGLCFRSDHNYAAQLARVLAVTSFTDASCAGATTTNVVNGAAHPVRGAADAVAQVASVTPSTSLVTVGIGGNDSGLFGMLFQTCASRANVTADVCIPYVTSRLPQVLKQTEHAVASTLKAVVDKAPDARVILVGYLRLTPTTKGCGIYPVNAKDLPVVASAEQALDAAMARGAADAGVEYASMRAVSQGHDACAGPQAWTNGASAPKNDGFPLHPNAAGMRAVAQQIRSRLG